MEDKRKVQLFSPYFTLSFSFSEKILAWNIIQKELKASKGEDIVKEHWEALNEVKFPVDLETLKEFVNETQLMEHKS